MTATLTLAAPLDAAWSPQHVALQVPALTGALDATLTIQGQDVPCQMLDAHGRVLVYLGLDAGAAAELRFTPCPPRCLPSPAQTLDAPRALGVPGREVLVGPRTPWLGFAGWRFTSALHCDTAYETATVECTAAGALFTAYRVVYSFAERRRYVVELRCYKLEPYVEVAEHFSLGLHGQLDWRLNPDGVFDTIVSRESFEGETQPEVQPLVQQRVRDVLCRLQMPVLSEYFIPNNRGWFALCRRDDPQQPMLGVLGLHGQRWREPVANMPELRGDQGQVHWQSSLVSGSRHWLLYVGPTETRWTPDRPLVFHRLHAQFNACRLDQHLDLTGEHRYDRISADRSFFPAGDYHAHARQCLETYPALRRVLEQPDDWLTTNGAMHLASFRYLLDPSAAQAAVLYERLVERFDRWVRQFQGCRTGQADYMKNVIGFSRYLRGMLLAFEMLQRDGALTEAQTRRLNDYFVFAARRITDQGRWPHQRTTLHPDHPESVRDFYTYGGEHKPDRLYWTNSLPNFQSDPLAALMHLAAVFPAHPDADAWLRLALDDLEDQLDAYCGQSGAWEESINYALYTFSYFVITFRALKAHRGIDYFQDSRMRRFAQWLVRFLGPRDKRWDLVTWPGVGNAVLPTGGGEYLLCYASQLDDRDPLRTQLLAAWQQLEANSIPSEHYPVVMAALAPLPRPAPALLDRRASECMDEVGVALRHRHLQADESYLFQKIGFAKDHYENDETSFNWYAKGVPLCMDYGTYTGEVAVGGAHNLVQIPEEDSLRRGYLKNHLFTELLDYTHCQCPVTLKLLWDRVRTFEEIENKDGKVHRDLTPYFYIGDRNPVGPKVWKVRLLLFVKPDYLVLFDRVYGEVPHRYNLHVTGSDLRRAGPTLTARGRFELDLLAFVQHPSQFDCETGELRPGTHRRQAGDAEHRQEYFRLYNRQDGIYRTVLFAQERDRAVDIAPLGAHGVRITTAQYTDCVFLHDEAIEARTPDASFTGRVGWIRRQQDGAVQACVPEGELISAFGVRIAGRGPWSWNLRGDRQVQIHAGPPRPVEIQRDTTPPVR